MANAGYSGQSGQGHNIVSLTTLPTCLSQNVQILSNLKNRTFGDKRRLFNEISQFAATLKTELLGAAQ